MTDEEETTNMIDLDAIEARIRDCKTYNFGLWNADKLAHEDAPAMLTELRHLRVIASGNQGAIVNSIIERARHTPTDDEREPSAERDLTPCGNLVCTGCRVCGCPALGIAQQAAPTDDEREVQANRYIAGHGDSQTRRDFLAGWDAAIRRTEVPEPSALTDDERDAMRAEAEKVQRAAWAEIHGQDPTRTYSVAEVKHLVYSFDNVIARLRFLGTTESGREHEKGNGLTQEMVDAGTRAWSYAYHRHATPHDAMRAALHAALREGKADD